MSRRTRPVTLPPVGRDAAPGRYAELHKAAMPGDLPREGRRGRQDVVHGAVADPNPALRGKRQRVAVNANTDALENEYAYGRIGDAAYRAGRAYGRILELAAGRPTGGGQWMDGDRVDAASAHELAIVRNITSARRALEVQAEVLPIVGRLGAEVLRMVLAERLTLAEVAERRDGSASRWAVHFWAETFRRALGALGAEWLSEV